ncbi:Phosphatase 1 regulatory subunit 7 [Dirofilaria immitis]|nr:Phosphatase 1 regulatory subunit 7 [Dirofilaria immitis]
MRDSKRSFWFAVLNRFSRLAFYRKPASGTIAVFGFLIMVPILMYTVGGYPMLHKDQFKEMATGDNNVSCNNEPIVDEIDMVERESGKSSRRNLFDLNEFDVDSEAIDLNQCRVDTIPDFSRFTQLKELCMRQNLLTSLSDHLAIATLTQLDLYDNQIEVISNLDKLVNLEILDLSYNRIRKIEGLSALFNLKRIYLKLENIGHLQHLCELYIGKNKIQKFENLENLTRLTVLSAPANRLIDLSGISMLTELTELHVSDQGIESLAELTSQKKLTIVDAANNKITKLDGLIHLDQLEDIWLNDNEISDWNELLKLSKLPALRTIYLERNPIYKTDQSSYRRKIMLSLPQKSLLEVLMLTTGRICSIICVFPDCRGSFESFFPEGGEDSVSAGCES